MSRKLLVSVVSLAACTVAAGVGCCGNCCGLGGGGGGGRYSAPTYQQPPAYLAPNTVQAPPANPAPLAPQQ
jgi:hypothetical protein